MAVLTGLARVAGWAIKIEHDPGESAEELQPLDRRKLGEISLELWGDRAMGGVAADIVLSRRKHSTGEVYLDQDRRHPLVLERARGHKGLKTDSLDPDTCVAIALRACAQLPLLYGFEMIPDNPPFNDRYRTRLAKIRATEPTLERLQRYLEETGLARHNLHGTLGMAVEVLKATAGIAPADNLASLPYSGQTVSNEVLRKILTPPDFKQHHRYTLLSRIGHIGCDQLKDGQPSDLGEVIFVGNLTLGERDQVNNWQRVALNSLRQLGELFRENSPAKRILQGPQLEERLQEAQE